tara:strand:- start:18656 stop:20407 length:1752 start_codon:yes stop_codon:yes gene_type:complete
MNDLFQLGQGHSYTDDTETIKNGEEFVSYGKDNNYPNFLINLYQKSAVHNALCNSISTWIYGDGVVSNDATINPEAWAKFKMLFDKGIGKNTLQKCILDLKVHGGYYLSISYSLDRTTISEIEHLPFETIRVQPEVENEDAGFYLYSKNWSNYRQVGYEKIKAFDSNFKNEYPNQIICFKMYSVGSYYYPKPDYQGGINYIELDKNVSEFHLANIKNGLAPSFLLSFSNGIPSDEKRQAVKNSIEEELSGSKNAGKFILSFSDDRSNAPEITPFPLSDADKQYEFLSKEVTSKVMISHRVISPRLFGVNTDGGGLGNNADELRTASILFEEVVVDGYRELLVEGMEFVMQEAGFPMKLKFVSKDVFKSEEKVDKEIREVEASMEIDMSDEDENSWLEYLQSKGEIINEKEWELLEETDVLDAEAEADLHENEYNFFKRYADPDKKSKIDKGLYKIRYRYSENLSDNSRLFCKNMVANAKSGVIYRFEDIKEMGDDGINGGFAERGKSKYSIWLYKGGCYCHHKFIRQVWFRKRDKGRFLPNKGLDNDKNVTGKEPSGQGLKNAPGWKKANTAPINMPNRGKVN